MGAANPPRGGILQNVVESCNLSMLTLGGNPPRVQQLQVLSLDPRCLHHRSTLAFRTDALLNMSQRTNQHAGSTGSVVTPYESVPSQKEEKSVMVFRC